MNATDIVSMFGVASDDERLNSLFHALNTLRRPQRPDTSNSMFYDWVLVRKKGLELGFVDEEFQLATSRFRWGHGKLLLAQAYFYSGTDEIHPFSGHLPAGLDFSDSRSEVREKLSDHEATRHSFVSDTWDLEGYRLTVAYKKNNEPGIDKVLCRMLPKPIIQTTKVIYPSIEKIHHAFGNTVHDTEFKNLWSDTLTKKEYESIELDGELDLNESFGASLGFVESGSGALFRSISFHRNRDQDSAGWGGPLPKGLDFEDSPATLFSKISETPAQQSNTELTGHAVWHFDEYTLHVLFSNIDNRLIRVKIIAPGTWKCIEDHD
ncbi:hypothetical protein ABXK61_13500 [Burkholderia sola]|uniref:hypothetical protein n=1 Tax=Burkholderia TaxID=32008 RepID=UPI001AE27670|nr:hypothetical protein [Burkholderia sp. AcTa6-5]MBP0714329.1 hypothetical protein [Burkholderia sp. AcTa6-5]